MVEFDGDGNPRLTPEERYLKDTFGNTGYTIVDDVCLPHGGETESPSVEDELIAIEERLEHEDTLDALQVAISCLPMRQGEIIKQRWMNGLTQQEVADNLGIDQSTVAKQEKAAFANLRAALLERGYCEDEMMDMLVNRVVMRAQNA